MDHAIRDNFPQRSREQIFFRSGPQVVAKGDLLGFWSALGRGHLEKFRARVENGENTISRGWGPEIEKKIAMLSGMVVRNFFYTLRFAQPDPQGREIADYRVFRPLRPLAHNEITGAG